MTKIVDSYHFIGGVTKRIVKTWIKSEDLPYEQRDHGWFASYATAGDRQLVVVVLVEHGGHGSTAAAPLAKRLYEIYFRDYLDNSQPS